MDSQLPVQRHPTRGRSERARGDDGGGGNEAKLQMTWKLSSRMEPKTKRLFVAGPGGRADSVLQRPQEQSLVLVLVLVVRVRVLIFILILILILILLVVERPRR